MAQAAAGSDVNKETGPSSLLPAEAGTASAEAPVYASTAGDALLAAQLQDEDQVLPVCSQLSNPARILSSMVHSLQMRTTAAIKSGTYADIAVLVAYT